jgi:hypothetical protein
MKSSYVYRRTPIIALAGALLLLPGCQDTTNSVLNTILLAFQIVGVWI